MGDRLLERSVIRHEEPRLEGVRHGAGTGSSSELEQMWNEESGGIVSSHRGHLLATIIIVVLSTGPALSI